jgi:uncharacterized membrane protein
MENLLTFKFITILACSIFSGAAIYINLVEHSARMSCGTEVAIAEWIPSYKRATIMQASLAVIGTICAISAWFKGANNWWLIGGVLFGLVIPYTFLIIMPINKKLLSPTLERTSLEANNYLTKWNKLHAIRSLLSSIALIIFLLNY